MLQPLIPSVFNEEDAEQIIQQVLKSSKTINSKDAMLIGQTTVANQFFIQKMRPIFDPMIQEKADEVQYLSIAVSKVNMPATKRYVLFAGG